jgi:lactate dehydrogenase-like 2-hydroxyacid dehydrogenase
LQHKRIAGAALDVFEKEPFVPKELYELDNVLMVPHIASATVQTRQAMGQRVLDNLNAAFKQQPMVSAA